MPLKEVVCEPGLVPDSERRASKAQGTVPTMAWTGGSVAWEERTLAWGGDAAPEGGAGGGRGRIAKSSDTWGEQGSQGRLFSKGGGDGVRKMLEWFKSTDSGLRKA